MVKAIQVHQPGGVEELKYEDVSLAAPGPGEVQIRHRAIGVNFIDIYRRSGVYPASYPFIPGHEGAGEVMALGEGVKEFKIGERVAYIGALGVIAKRATLRRPHSFICQNQFPLIKARQ